MSLCDIRNTFLFDIDQLLMEDKAFHGSPYNFNEFDTAFMGSGEGAQVHGWGLYFSLEPQTVYRRYGTRITSDKPDAFRTILYKDKSFFRGTQAYMLFKCLMEDGKEKTLARLDNALNDADYISEHPDYTEKLNRLKDIIEKIDEDGIQEIKMVEGQNYTVDIPDVNTFLVEEKPFKNQPQNVKDAVNAIVTSYNNVTNAKEQVKNNADGESIYAYIGKLVSEMSGSNERKDKQASLELLKYGVPGIKYHGYSDGDCVVIFSGKDVKIIQKDHGDTNDEQMVPTAAEIAKMDGNEIRAMGELPQKTQTAIINARPDYIKYITKPSAETILSACKKSRILINSITAEQLEEHPELMIKLIELSKSGYIFYRTLNNATPQTNLNWITKDMALAAVKSYDSSDMIHVLRYDISAMKYEDNKKMVDEILCQEVLEAALNNKELRNIMVSQEFCVTSILLATNKFYKDLKPETMDILLQFLLIARKNELQKAISVMSRYVDKATPNFVNRVALKYPKIAKYVDINETTQRKLVKKNPYNIRFIKNPTQAVKQMAINANEDVKNYIYED